MRAPKAKLACLVAVCLVGGWLLANIFVIEPTFMRRPEDQSFHFNKRALHGRTIGFFSNQLDFRGVGRALFDYAYHAEEYLGLRAVIWTLSSSKNFHSSEESRKRFSSRFRVHYVLPEELCKSVREETALISILAIVAQTKDNPLANCRVPSVALGVFGAQPAPGYVAARISQVVRGCSPNDFCPVLPHMVNVPKSDKDWRAKLGIPRYAKVFCRHGGIDTFDVDNLSGPLLQAVAEDPLIWLLFLNTPKFSHESERIRFFPPLSDYNNIREFINTCDAMVYGRRTGETFGLAIAEFSFCNKPIILHEKDHTKGFHSTVLLEYISYKSYQDLPKVLKDFDRLKIQSKNWNFYQQFSPQKVMSTFHDLVVAPYLTQELNY